LNKIEIKLDKSIGERIYNYCHILNTYDYEHKFYNNYCDLIPNKSTKFMIKYKEFESNLYLLESNLSKYNFEEKNLIQYEQIYKPNTNILIRNKINSNTIPDYKVSCSVSGGGIGSLLGTCVVITIQLSWVF
jgi:hypothetical protein